MKAEILGIQLNMWGLYCAIGAAASLAAAGVFCRARGLKKGSAPLLGLLSVIMGIICSRCFYCLVVTLTQTRMPIAAWLQATDGGWSMYGMIGGVFLGAWLSGKILREKPVRMLDAVSVGLPLMITAERIGEGALEQLFDYGRSPQNPLSAGFFTVMNPVENTYVPAVYHIKAAAAGVMFLALVFSLLKSARRDGNLWISFMILCGAGGVLTESLRYDHFLVFSFVRLEQVLAALLLLGGVIAAGHRCRHNQKILYISALVSMLLTVTGCIGIEFALDRVSVANRIVVYAVMICSLLIPVIHAFVLLHSSDGSFSRRKVNIPVWSGMILSVAEICAIGTEMSRIHSTNSFMLIILGSAVCEFLFLAGTAVFCRRNPT